MKLGDLTKAENPISGKSFNLFDIGHLWSLALGAGALLFVASLGQRVFSGIGTKVPFVSTKINDPITHPVQAQTQMRVI